MRMDIEVEKLLSMDEPLIQWKSTKFRQWTECSLHCK